MCVFRQFFVIWSWWSIYVQEVRLQQSFFEGLLQFFCFLRRKCFHVDSIQAKAASDQSL